MNQTLGAMSAIGTALGPSLIALTLAAYALAMTVGRSRFDPLNMAFLLAAALGLVIIARAEARAASPLIRLGTFRDLVFSASLALGAAGVGIVMRERARKIERSDHQRPHQHRRDERAHGAAGRRSAAGEPARGSRKSRANKSN